MSNNQAMNKTNDKIMQKHFFITATDTDAGKTYFSCLLIKALTKRNYKVAVYKPISAGCDEVVFNHKMTLINEDARLLQQQANCRQPLTEINPIAFKAAIAPHIAAKRLKQQIKLINVEHGYQQVCQRKSDLIITEGAGGWRLPLGQGKFLSDFVKANQQSVILVVNIKLGCLNHALLSYESIINDGVNCVAWVANFPEATQASLPYIEENITELSDFLPIPLLAKLSHQPDLDLAVKQINLDVLF